MRRTAGKVIAWVLILTMIQWTGGAFSFAASSQPVDDTAPVMQMEEPVEAAGDPIETAGDSAKTAEAPEEAAADSEESAEVPEEAAAEPEEAEPEKESAAEEDGEAASVDVEETEEADVAEPEEAEADSEKAASKTEYRYSDKQIEVVATVKDAAAIPDDAELVVTPVTSESKDYNYNAYMEALNADLEEDAYTDANTLLYDIAFLVDGQEIQPAEGSVDVSIQFKDNQLSEGLNASGKDDVQVLHLPLKKSVQEDFATTAEATEIEAADIQVEPVDAEVSVGKKESTSFTAETFSVWAWNNGAAGTITIPELEGEFGPDAPQYELNGPFGSLANFGVVGFSEIDQGDHLHSNFATRKYVLNTSAGFGMRESKNGVTNTHKELYYIGESITGSQGSTNMEIHVPDSILLLGHDLGASGTFTGGPNANNYSINVGGKTINVTTGDKAAVQEGSGYVAKSIRQEPADSHYVDLDKMKEEAETQCH